MTEPAFILTTGEPAGIGPDLCVQLALELANDNIVLCGDIDLLRERAVALGVDVEFCLFDDSQQRRKVSNKTNQAIAVKHIALATPVVPGQLDCRNAHYVLAMLTEAVTGCQRGDYAGIITAPIHKGIICDAGVAFSGHTEFFAEKLQVPCPVMLLASANLKVALVTTHLPLRDVASAITPARLRQTLKIIAEDGQRYLTNGRALSIGVCGLNPHAGESGHLGNEEITVINPVLASLRASGVNVSDAMPADTIFAPHHVSQFDVIVAMYHDQGLAVIKSHDFGGCVNITLGLPIIRTSVDHGTALDLAGAGKANPNSLRCAIAMAKQMVTNAQKDKARNTTDNTTTNASLSYPPDNQPTKEKD
ncbi:4-hydroxythreonine-4-phosphate dehydrogenase PdxA [Ostreibacterium oceani]|uniref:4-hydroxythreonine-4-phosphate dehydrogenase PdxA n=1 Tax=Ostreibacterium oceani TaxID=2654998 RepID=A0A6N7ERL6_9GAMM|nr:4-hydroxythreonine-4-phosphate dehydrogenase PdxA [Ostreibacterium oceani]MPV85181.1 4-hydroxythreonine-4-phosphate dehydrogenase PdxA [Ostreibacterium oceani]